MNRSQAETLLKKTFSIPYLNRVFVGEAMKMMKDQAMTGEQTLERLFRTYVEVWYIKAEIKEAEQKAKEQSALTKRNKAVQINIRRKEYDHSLTLADIKANRMPANILRSVI
jgi:5-bromo-4-chloroindolyl phosphate hydrolysis protein